MHGSPKTPRKNIVSNDDADDIKKKKTLFKNKSDAILLMSAASVCYLGLCDSAMIAPFFPPVAAVKGCNKFVIGLIIAVRPFMMFLFSPFVGTILPRVGIKKVVAAGCVMQASGSILFGFAVYLPSGSPFIIYCFVVCTFSAAGSATTETSVLAMIPGMFPDNQNAVYGLFEMFVGVSLASGPALGGILYHVGGYTLPFLVVGSLTIIFFIIMFLVLPSKKGEEKKRQVMKGGITISKILTSPVAVIICTNTTVSCASISFLEATLANHLLNITHYKLSPMATGFMFICLTGSFVCCTPLVGTLVDKKKINGFHAIAMGSFVISIGYLFVGPSYPISVFVPRKLYVVGLALGVVGIGWAIGVTPVIVSIKQCVIDAGCTDDFELSSVASGLFNSAIYAGFCCGAVIGGSLTEYLPFSFASNIMALIIVFPSILMFIILMCKMQRLKTCINNASEFGIDDHQSLHAKN